MPSPQWAFAKMTAACASAEAAKAWGPKTRTTENKGRLCRREKARAACLPSAGWDSISRAGAKYHRVRPRSTASVAETTSKAIRNIVAICAGGYEKAAE